MKSIVTAVGIVLLGMISLNAVVLSYTNFAHRDGRTGVNSFSSVYLVELSKKKPTKMMGSLLPNRVYSRYEPSLGRWVLTLTDKNRKFAHPMEVLIADSILPGSWLGSANLQQNYRLLDNGKWIPTDVEAKLKVIVQTNPRLLKTMSFKMAQTKKGNLPPTERR